MEPCSPASRGFFIHVFLGTSIMNEDKLDQILKELKKISQILEQKNEQEKLKKDLDGLDFKTNAEACNKVGGMQ